MKIKQTIKKVLYKCIEHIEKIEYKNIDLSNKFLESIKLEGVEIETDTGFKKVTHIHKTKPYEIFELYLENSKKTSLTCADNHIVFDSNMREVFVKDLVKDDFIQTKNGLKRVEKIVKLYSKISMFDLTIDDDKHRFYSNDILSHNTVMTTVFIVHNIIFKTDFNILCASNIEPNAKEILNKTRIILENLPFFMRPGVMKNDVKDMVFDNGNRLRCVATTKRSGIGRSLPPSLVIN